MDGLWVTLFQVPLIMLDFPISFQTNVHNQKLEWLTIFEYTFSMALVTFQKSPEHLVAIFPLDRTEFSAIIESSGWIWKNCHR